MELNFNDLTKAPRIARISDIFTNENEDYRRKIIFNRPPIYRHNSQFIENLFPKGNNVVYIGDVCTEIFSTTFGMIDCFVSLLPDHYNDIELKSGELIAPLIQWENKYECSEIIAMMHDLHLFCEEIRRLYNVDNNDDDILESFGLN